eukprot:TRINITY_DN14825_c0_g1_i1.p1 TRINITY_DN14825_c0_g1~~TRINITY_DN14825_c0_g1_i1.p1  ORF type:complete len:369 (-),score=39.83 TRINITY_DN14825_c0_g1_i1:636-1742(-)
MCIRDRVSTQSTWAQSQTLKVRPPSARIGQQQNIFSSTTNQLQKITEQVPVNEEKLEIQEKEAKRARPQSTRVPRQQQSESQKQFQKKNLLSQQQAFSDIEDEFYEDNEPSLMQQAYLTQQQESKVILTKNINQITSFQKREMLSSSKRVAYEIINQKNEKLKSRSKDKQQYLPSDYLSEVPSKKLQSPKSNIRPITGNKSLKFPVPQATNYLATIEQKLQGQSKLLNEAATFDTKQFSKKQQSKHSYIVYKKNQGPRLVGGHNAMNLETYQRAASARPKYVHDQIFSPFLYSDPLAENRIQKMLGIPFPIDRFKVHRKDKPGILPLEYYIVNNEEDYMLNELLQKNRDKDGRAFGFSKWFDTDGTYD